MARIPRIVLPGQPHHIIQRGNNRSPIFFVDDDYRLYLRWLSESCNKHDCAIHAYVLMTNHVHLLLTPTREDTICRTMQTLGRRYVRYINETYQRTGTLWEGRYKSSLIDSERYLLTCYRYIELNPVRAGMVNHPEDYPWSSYHHNAYGKKDTLISEHYLYLALDSSVAARYRAYRQLFATDIDNKSVNSIRECTHKGWVLGNDRFKELVGEQLNTRVTPRQRGGDHRSRTFREQKKTNLL